MQECQCKRKKLSGKGKARAHGELWAKQLMMADPSIKQLIGSGFWDDFSDGFKTGFMGTIKAGAPVLAGLAGAGKKKKQLSIKPFVGPEIKLPHIMGKGKKVKKKRKPLDPNSKTARRNKIVKKIMTENKLSLPQASKYVKEHKIPY